MVQATRHRKASKGPHCVRLSRTWSAVITRSLSSLSHAVLTAGKTSTRIARRARKSPTSRYTLRPPRQGHETSRLRRCFHDGRSSTVDAADRCARRVGETIGVHAQLGGIDHSGGIAAAPLVDHRLHRGEPVAGAERAVRPAPVSYTHL